MTSEHKHLVQTSWEQVTPTANTAASLFYNRLFEFDPALQRLFASTQLICTDRASGSCTFCRLLLQDSTTQSNYFLRSRS